jgi:hypothetical protein
MNTIEFIMLPFYLYFFYWIISTSIFMYRLERHFGKNFNKPIKNNYKKVIRQKICTQTQPFKNIICNFPCDGNCQLIK